MIEPSPWTAPVAVSRCFSETSPVTLKTAKNSDAKVLVSRVESIDTCHTEETGCISRRGELIFLPAAGYLHKNTKDIQQLQARSCCQRELYWDYLTTYPRHAWWSIPIELHLSRGRPWFHSQVGWLEFSMTKGYTVASGVFLQSKRALQWIFDHLPEEGMMEPSPWTDHAAVINRLTVLRRAPCQV